MGAGLIITQKETIRTSSQSQGDSVVVHVCESEAEADEAGRPKQQIVQTRRPEGPPTVLN
ncbi:Calcipressin-2 [Liparis tanakae]|uniref:Calcipressin-2 n=1 Tax=Liparis tanakae TaxID=230148 RepID=A0A4Z2IP80_9TELE|nr:Calcipressin-2 [Liparis tanakae]